MISVLVVDDDPGQADAVADLLSEAGYHARAVNGPLAAMASYADQHYEVVLTDFMMPVMTGGHLIEKLRAMGDPRACFIVMSAMDAAFIQAACGAHDAFLHKPFVTEALYATIERCRRQKRTTQSRGENSCRASQAPGIAEP